MIYKLIWFLLQICITIFQQLRLTFHRLLKISRSYDRRRDSNSYTDLSIEDENAYLDICREQIIKLPRHLSLIIGPDEQIEDELITRIIKYALRMNIECVSFYDARSSESDRRVRLHKLQHPKDMICKQLEERYLLWTTRGAPGIFDTTNSKPIESNCNGYTSTNGYNRKNGHKNGFKNVQSIEIYEIETSDGRALISEVCRKLFIQRQSNEIQDLLQSRTLLSQRIDKELSLRLWNFTDPELCIVFSKHMCTYGMMPWHIRFTEFYLHQQKDLFDAKTFSKILLQFSRCEQRWGK